MPYYKRHVTNVYWATTLITASPQRHLDDMKNFTPNFRIKKKLWKAKEAGILLAFYNVGAHDTVC